MTRFSDFLPLEEPEQRKGILATLPESVVVELVKVASRDQDLAWLTPMVDGGLLDLDALGQAEGDKAMSLAEEWERRARAFVGFLENIAFEPLHHDELVGYLPEPIDVLVHRPEEAVRSLFADAVSLALPVVERLKDTHADWASMKIPLGEGMALLLVGAIAMDLPETVRAVVRAFEDAARVPFTPFLFGPCFAAFAPDENGVPEVRPGVRVNATGVAVRLSRRECLAVLVDHDAQALDRLGTHNGVTDIRMTDLNHSLLPGCFPALWGEITARRFVGRCTEENFEEPEDGDLLNCDFDYAPLELLEAQQNNRQRKCMAPYLSAMVARGVYDAQPESMLIVAVGHGHPRLVERLVDRVVDWPKVERFFKATHSPIVQAAVRAVQDEDPVRKKNYANAVSVFLKGALAHGQQAGFVHVPQEGGMTDTEVHLQPFHTVAEAGFAEAVVLYLAQGFDVHQSCDFPGNDNPSLTPMAQLALASQEAAGMVRSCLARAQALALLDEIQRPTASPSP